MHGPWALAVLYFLGLWWCYAVIRRLPQDVREIREPGQAARTTAIVFVWVLTIVIAILLIAYSLVIIEETVSFVRTL
jgi:uncharacterized membrane protein SpoIIM required for sporulation